MAPNTPISPLPDVDAQGLRAAPGGDRLLWLIGGFKLVKGLALVAAGVAAVYLAGHDAAEALTGWVAELHLHPSSRWINRLLSTVLSVDPRTLRAIGVGTFVYAGIFITEGVGLLLRQRWAEYLTAIVTTSFLPLEVYELFERVSPSRLVLVAANLAIVLYLIARLRVERREG